MWLNIVFLVLLFLFYFCCLARVAMFTLRLVGARRPLPQPLNLLFTSLWKFRRLLTVTMYLTIPLMIAVRVIPVI